MRDGTNTNFWSSTESGTNAWRRNLNVSEARVNRNTNDKLNGFSVRCLKDWLIKPAISGGFNNYMQLSLFETANNQEMNSRWGRAPSTRFQTPLTASGTSTCALLYDLFQAYYDARINKRNTINALAFEIDYEKKLFELYEQITNRAYQISRSICFIVFKPVKREIFAADFRDRIVHHLIYNYINPIFEPKFINDSYSCRTGKGTSYGIKRLEHFIRSCTQNYTKDCYILKLDIEGYFMAMDRTLLYERIKNHLINSNPKIHFDVNLVLYLLQIIIFNDPTKNCIIKGKKADWKGLPPTKSLFYSGNNKGFPIGNLTSQLFGNIYLNDFDHYIKYKLGIKYYGRYVDDFVIVHPNKEYLKSIIPLLSDYLQSHLSLKLHPKKIYLQHYTKGVKFLGVVVKPYRIYIGNQTKGTFYKKIQLK